MRSAHELSRPYNIDPAYSVGRTRPSPRGLSLFSSRRAGPFWLYGWGELEAYLLARIRKEGFLGCYEVLHPGLFEKFSPILLLKASFRLRSLPEDGRVVLYHSGDLRLKVNERIALHVEGTKQPVRRSLSLAKFLRPGENSIYITLNRLDEPPAFLMGSSFIQSDASWSAGRDHYHWSAPACFSFEGARNFPHQERLPAIVLQPRSRAGDTYDFGADVLGKPVIGLAGGHGRLTVRVGETLEEIGDASPCHREQYVEPLRASARTYTTKGEAAFRYLRVQAPGMKVRGIQALASFYPTRYRGAFACSDDVLNAIWMRSAYTLRACMREFLVDGIKRDRMPWLGDTYVSLLSNAFSFAEREIVERTLTALWGEDPAKCDFNGVMEYTLFWVMGLEKYLFYFGDYKYLERAWSRFVSLMRVLEAKEDQNGFLVADGSTWLVIDWAHIEKAGVVAALQMLYAMALQSAARLAAARREGDRAARLMGKASRLQEQCRHFFWSERAGGFVDNFARGRQGRHLTRHANFLAILSGTASKKQEEAILRNVLLGNKVAPVGTPYMKFFECLALCRVGRHAEMIEAVKEYWGGMLEAGATTFWEAYDARQSGSQRYSFYGRPFGKSLCHAWASGPIYLLSAGLFGIEPSDMGWKAFHISPHVANLKWMCASIPTPLGNIEVDVEGSRVRVKAPAGAAPVSGAVRRGKG